VRGVMWLLGAAVVGLLVAVGWWWVAQNTDQVVQLRLDLTGRVGAWQMREPVQATVLMLGSFAAGAVAAGLPLLVWATTRRRATYADFNS
jgi:hypothetical protein